MGRDGKRQRRILNEFLCIQTLSSQHSFNSSLTPPTHLLLHFQWHHIHSPYPNALALLLFFRWSDSPHFVSFLFSFWYFIAEGWQNILSIILCHRVLLQPRYGMQWYIGILLAFWWYKTNSLKLPLSPLVLNLTSSLSHTLSCLFSPPPPVLPPHIFLCLLMAAAVTSVSDGFLMELLALRISRRSHKTAYDVGQAGLKRLQYTRCVWGIEIEWGSGLNACILLLISLCAYVCVSSCDSKCLSVCSSYGAD